MIKEGDSGIQRSDKHTAKNYHEAYLASQERVKELVYAYNIYVNQIKSRAMLQMTTIQH